MIKGQKIVGTILLLCTFLHLIYGIGMITPTQYPRVSVLSEGQKAVFTFYFKVDTSIKAGNYLKIQLSNFPTLSSDRCVISYNSSSTWEDSECSNLPAEPNILYIKLPSDLENTYEENALQIDLQQNNPISSQSNSIQFWTVDRQAVTGFFVYDLNQNFGQIPFQPPTSEQLQATLLQYGTLATESKPSGINILKFSVQINEQIGDENLQTARIKIVLTSPWQFLADSEVTAEADPRHVILNPLGEDNSRGFLDDQLYKEPTISSFTIESPNQMSIVFGEYFKSGRSFIVQVTQIQNSPIKASGQIRLYTMNYNSNIILEQNENLKQLEISFNEVETEVLPPSSLSYIGPIGFYKGTTQFVRVRFQTDTDVPENYHIKIQFPNYGGGANSAEQNSIIKGTGYVSSNVPNISGKKIKYSYTNTIMTISNLGALAKETDYFIQVRVELSTVEATLQAKIGIDASASSSPGTELFQGESDKINMKTNADSVISRISFDGTTDDFLRRQSAAGTSQIVLDINALSAIDTDNTSYLEIYAIPQLISGGVTCAMVDGGSTPIATDICTLVTTASSHTKITIGHATANSFPAATVLKLTLGALDYDGVSNYQDLIYDIHFRFYRNNQPDSDYLDWVLSPTVYQQLVSTDLQVDIMNKINNNVGSESIYVYPSFVNFVAKTATTFNYPRQANEVFTITIWAFQGFKSIVNPVSSEEYPCGSNLDGVTCQYIEGISVLRETQTPHPNYMELDRVHIFLPNTASTTAFHSVIPDQYLLTMYNLLTDHYLYEYNIALGLYNTETRTFRYVTRQNTITFNPGDTFVRALNSNLSVTLAGVAGSQINSVQLSAITDGGHTVVGNDGTNFGSGIILVTDWEIWKQGVSGYSGVPHAQLSANPENSPVSFKYADRQVPPVDHYVTIFPFVGNAQVNLNQQLDNIFLPFKYDLPNYNMYLTDKDGVFQTYTSYYNSGPNWFYQGTLPSLDMSCLDQSKGIVNTYCEIWFQNNILIKSDGKIYVDFVGLELFTDTCVFQHENPADPSDKVILENAVCAVNIHSNQLVISVNEDSILPINRKYRITFYGLEIQDDPMILQRYIDLSTRDESGRFIIESKQKQIATTVYEPQYIQITQIAYKEINSYVFSSLQVYFTTPRDLYPNENIALDMGTDLNDVNTNTDRVSVRLFRESDGSELQIAVNFELQKMKVLFEDRTQFTADSYRIDIHNIRNPTTNDNDYFKIQFIRDFDNSLVLTNIASTTSPFPAFLDRTVSDIVLEESRYLQEGALQELKFRIRMQKSKVDSRTRIIISFPIYYCPAVTNFANLLSCRINGISIQCQKDDDSPYRLVISNSPVNLHVGEQFTLKVFGIVTPQKQFRDLAAYQQETLFVGVDTGNGDNFYTEFVHLVPPPVNAGLNTQYLYIQFIDIPNKYSGSLSLHSIKLYTEKELPGNTELLIVFPVDYATLIITSQLQCNVRFEDGGETASTSCPVEGRGITVSIGPSDIESKSYFYVQIQDVPTPPFDGEVDFNDTIIQAYNPLDYSIETRNFYMTNRMQVVNFKKLNNVLKVNNNQPIEVVKGTYSQNILITTPEDERYITNLQLDVAATGFEFQPKSMSVYLGDFETKFRIGALKNLQEKPYQFVINMEEKYFKKYYSIANTYVIFLTTRPVQIQIPETVRVPLGGCSLPYILKIDNTPQDELEISVQYNYKQYPEQVFHLDLELSSYVLEYSKDISYRYLSFCITDDYDHSMEQRRNLQALTESSMKVGLHVGGYNSPAYALQYSDINLHIVTKDNVAPTLQINTNTIKRTEFIGDIVIPTDGVLYWHLYVKDTAEDFSLTQIKFYVKYQNLILQSSTDTQDNVLGIKVDERVGMEIYNSTVTPHQITLKDLQPETNYKLCGYFENQFKNATETQTCIEFLTGEWDLFTKVTIQFTKNAYEDMLNDLLCFYVRQVKTRIFNIISTSGISCSFGVSPDYYYYKYKGDTYSQDQFATNIYLIPDLDIETDIALDTLRSFYNDGDLSQKQEIIDIAEDDHQIDFIKSGFYIKKFQYSKAINAQEDFTIPTIKNITFTSLTTSTEASIHATDIELSQDGVVYFILERIYKLEFDPYQEEFKELPVNVIKNPTAAQIIDCKNAFGTPAQRCARAVVTNSQKVETIFEDLLFQSGYIAYYVLANEYPLRPIFGETVHSKQVHVGKRANDSSGSILYLSILYIILVLSSLL